MLPFGFQLAIDYAKYQEKCSYFDGHSFRKTTGQEDERTSAILGKLLIFIFAFENNNI